MGVKDLIESLRLSILKIGTLSGPFLLRTDIFKVKVLHLFIHVIILLSFEVIFVILFRLCCSSLFLFARLDFKMLFVSQIEIQLLFSRISAIYISLNLHVWRVSDWRNHAACWWDVAITI